MPRKPQQQRSKATVDAIVDAGFLALARHGRSGTTTRHIADLAGIGVGSLYEYFANKEAVYQAMSEQMNGEIVAMIRRLMPRIVQLPVRDAVFELLSAFRELLERDDSRYLRYAGLSTAAESRGQLEPIQRLLRELVMQYAMHHPELLAIRSLPVMSYIFINGGIFTILHHLAQPHPMIPFDALARGLADMIGHTLDAEAQRPYPSPPGAAASG